MAPPALRLNDFLPASRANGPGRRAVLWTQGCSLACPGCFNPHTHDGAAGFEATCDALLARLLALGDAIEGVTLTGGEPLQQRAAVVALARALRWQSRLSIVVFTGYSFDEVGRMPQADVLLGSIDVLIAGRYQHERRLGLALRGSANKTVHFLTDRYGPGDLADVPAGEVVLTATGEVIVSGIDPLTW